MSVHLLVDVRPDGGFRVVTTRCGETVRVRMADSLHGHDLTGWAGQVTCGGCTVTSPG